MELIRRPIKARVTETSVLTRQLVRVTVAADELDRFEYVGPDQLVRIFLPPRVGAPLVLPKTEQWWPEFQELSDEDRPVLRNYTVRAFDPVARQLSIDFVVHGTGPGSTFAQRARPGDELGVLSDGADYSPPADTEWQLLVGDETALPAIASIIEQLQPDARAVAFVEVRDRDDELPIPRHPGVRLHWLHRGDIAPGKSDMLLSRLRETALPRGRAYAWVAGESSLVTSVRRHLVTERGLEKPQVYFCGTTIAKVSGMDRVAEETWRSRIRGCLLGGAIGDALGGPVEFESGRSIVAAHPDRLRTFVSGSAGWPPGTITDDTQMTLFTVEGLIRAGVRTDRGIGFTVAVVHHAYDRWLDTQTLPGPSGERDGWLQGEQWLYARRAPGNTCLGALTEARKGNTKIDQFGAQAVNNSKGCGGVMRVAPFGLLPAQWFDRDWVFDSAAKAAGYTHGHPTGKLASGALAVIIRELCEGADLNTALDTTAALLEARPDHAETSTALAAARQLAATAPGHGPVTVEQLGGGWVAEEALAIAVYAALAYPEPEQFLDALALSVTHSGDSDSTGAICGNILGALHGETALPPELAFTVEGRAVILELADDFALEFTKPSRLHGDYGPHTAWGLTRYPGW